MAKGKPRDMGLEREWRRRMGRWGRAGQGVREFCRGEGVRESAFYYWRRELGRRDRAASGHRSRAGGSAGHLFLPVTIRSASGTLTADVEIALADGTVIRGSSAATPERLVQVAAALRDLAAEARPRRVRPC